MGALHVLSIFLSAFLLFLVQPMIAKALLPGFGGSPAVWGTCLVAFQALLLAAYAWADRARKLAPQAHAIAVCVVVLVPLAFLPPELRTAPPPPSSTWPIPALMAAIAASVAAPFFALANNSTQVQHWYAQRASREPYFLYAASNLGSLLALLAYPFAIEPYVGLAGQRAAFSLGYQLFAGVTVILAVSAVLRAQRAGAAGEGAAALADGGSGGSAPVPTRLERWRWVWLSAIPSGLLVSTSMHISTDVASVPLLWVLPLMLYLATFVLAFAPRSGERTGFFPREVLAPATGLLVVASAAVLHPAIEPPLLVELVLALATLFAGAWFCHGGLVALRPGPARLGEFYLWLSFGGLVGGFSGNLIAPLLFKGVEEYVLFLLALALVLLPPARIGDAKLSRVAAAAVVVLAVPILADAILGIPSLATLAPVLGVAAGYLVPGVPAGTGRMGLGARYALLGAATGILTGGMGVAGTRTLEAGRSFFGVVRILESEDGLRMMMHGTTVHGHEYPKVPHPIGYYYPAGPIARAVALAPEGARIGVVGLGTGGVAGLARGGQTVDFYEIDPIVEPMARAWFRYLSHSPAKVTTVLGDARLTLALAEDGAYDLLLMDAFTSDAIPVHLITREALELYARKLRPGGRMLVHVSNRYLDVAPVVHGGAQALGLEAVRIEFQPTADEAKWGAFPSRVVALARERETLAPLVASGWRPFGPEERAISWTDDRSSLLEVIAR